MLLLNKDIIQGYLYDVFVVNYHACHFISGAQLEEGAKAAFQIRETLCLIAAVKKAPTEIIILCVKSREFYSVA